MIIDEQFRLAACETIGVNRPGNWYPWDQPVVVGIIIVIVLVARASKFGKAVTDIMAGIAELG